MMNRILPIFLITVSLLIASNTAAGQETTKPAMSQHLHEILKWLPDDSETLVVANGPFELPADLNEVQPFLDSARSLSFGLLTQLQEGFITKQLKGKKVLIAVEASRRFTSPKGLGMMPFEGCQILKFDDADHDVVQAAIESCFEKAPQTVQVGDTEVAVFTEQWESDEWSLLVAQPQRGVLLCATNQKFLEQILERMKHANPDRAFPDSLPEWEHLNLNASVWGMRHYRKEFADTDPSSPFRTRAAANFPDSQAIGFVFWFDAKAEKAAKARYLSGTKDAIKIVQRGWNHSSDNLIPTINEIKPGVIEITSSIGQDNSSGHMFLFVLQAYLGHAVYL